MVRKETSSHVNWREAFGATALCCVYSSYRVKSFFELSSVKSQFLWKLRKAIGNVLTNLLKKKYLPIKNRKKLSLKLF